MKTILAALMAAPLLWAVPALADSHGHDKKKMEMAEGLAVASAWARATPPTAKNGAAYLTVVNHGTTPARLVAARADVAGRVELHVHEKVGEVMKMHQVPYIEVPARGSVALKPRGYHVMFLGLNAPFKDGESFMLTLRFDDGAETAVHVPIRKAGSAAEMKHSH